jgi:hypothetical protein
MDFLCILIEIIPKDRELDPIPYKSIIKAIFMNVHISEDSHRRMNIVNRVIDLFNVLIPFEFYEISNLNMIFPPLAS